VIVVEMVTQWSC